MISAGMPVHRKIETGLNSSNRIFHGIKIMQEKSDHENRLEENVAVPTPVPVTDMFGFYGTLKGITGVETAKRLWNSAFLTVSVCFQERDPAVVRNFLRSRAGRYLADSVTDFADSNEFGNFDVMHFAVMNAILHPDGHGPDKNKSTWLQDFNIVKKITRDGEWVD